MLMMLISICRGRLNNLDAAAVVMSPVRRLGMDCLSTLLHQVALLAIILR